MAEKDAIVIAKAWFKPDLILKLTAGKVAKEGEKLGLTIPRCGLQQALCHFGRQLLRGQFVKITKTRNLSRADIIKM